MTPDEKLQTVARIMSEFADLTGLSEGGEAQRRYLWTDAFAVCNFLGLHGETGVPDFLESALELVEAVHQTLGRHRGDDPRSGWISGLSEEEGRGHPTVGGLRIGKPLSERRPHEPFDEDLEWDRDGQYFHYLTKWMHALNRVSLVTGNGMYHVWAIELAQRAHARFSYTPPRGGRMRMVWKMSVDLSRALVPSMGHHDALDGFITCSELQSSIDRFPQHPKQLGLAREISEMAAMCEGEDWVTDDPLGLGGLLADAYRVAQLAACGGIRGPELLGVLMDAADRGLHLYAAGESFRRPAHARLAFREFGLSIGLNALVRLEGLLKRRPGAFRERPAVLEQAERLLRYAPMIDAIEHFWLDTENRRARSWTEHELINMVMLATSLAPDGYLQIRPLPEGTTDVDPSHP